MVSPIPPAAITDFLAQRRIALVGASRSDQDFSRLVLRALLAAGYEVAAVNPRALQIEGARAFTSVRDIEPPVDAALLMTPPSATDAAVEDCIAAGIRRIWLHRGAGQGAVSPGAVRACREAGISLVEGACPLMFLPGAEKVHQVHRDAARWLGSYPAAGPRAPGWAHLALAVVHLLVALSAVGAGSTLVLEPGGQRLGFGPELLAGTPFADFRWPGLLLAIVVGGTSGVAAAGHLRRSELAWLYSLVAGTALLGWMIGQVALIGVISLLQPLMFGVALLSLWAALRGMRRERPPLVLLAHGSG